MAFRVKSTFGPSGLADVRVTTKGVKVIMQDGNTYELPAGATERASGKYNVSLSQDLTKILFMKPIGGTYVVHFKEFGNRVNGIPQHKVQRGGPRQSRDGKKKWVAPDQLVCTVVLEVESDGIYEGLTITKNLPYCFVPSPMGATTDMYDSPSNLKQWEEFYRAVGLNEDVAIPYSPNVLPWLERELQDRGPFMVTTSEKGFVDSFAPIPAELRKAKPKKAAK
ncbi:MAG TPA: hypothetical protein VIY48_09600 [Candidatus Paceibacterota bacterium]